MAELYDVIIAGAGPIGLFLACELGLRRVSVLVLEHDLDRESPWKVEPLGWRGLNTQSIEAFYRRGLLTKEIDAKERPRSLQKTAGFGFGGHFAGIGFNVNELDLDRFKYRLNGPALHPGPTTIDRIERVLTERAESLGVTILRRNGVSKIAAQDDDSVTVEAGENQLFRGKWLVGCDGGRSAVRKAAGFDFVGTEARSTGYAIKCNLDPPDKLKKGFINTGNGMYIRGFPGTLHLMDFDGGKFDRKQEITQEHLQDVLNRITSSADVKITKVDLASTFTDRSKQTTKYRRGRVLLAGDAAHIHGPYGSQGLNLGIGDAMNLGWKLAATVHHESKSDGPVSLKLLDTYEKERHPIAASVLQWTRAQVSTLEPGLYGKALYGLISDLISTTDGTNLFIDRAWGLSQRYSLGEDEAHKHPLVGSSAPDFEIGNGERLGPKLERGRGLLVDFEGKMEIRGLVEGGYEGRVGYLAVDVEDRRGLSAFLVRPDGVVAWVVADGVEPDIDAAKAAIMQWFGS
jgi:2-polyprenyl-6-methoxyphenol hydroxylase-like FAD-dependent oxidoreductase